MRCCRLRSVWTVSPTIANTFSEERQGAGPLSLAWEQQAERLLLAGYGGGLVARIDVTNGAVARFNAEGEWERAEHIACSPDGSTVAVALCNGEESRLALLALETMELQEMVNLTPGQPQVISCLHFNHNGTLLIAGSGDGLMHIVGPLPRSWRTPTFARTRA